MLADSYTPQLLSNRPPPINYLLSVFERMKPNPSIMQRLAKIVGSPITQSGEISICPYPGETVISRGQDICFFDVFGRRK